MLISMLQCQSCETCGTNGPKKPTILLSKPGDSVRYWHIQSTSYMHIKKLLISDALGTCIPHQTLSVNLTNDANKVVAQKPANSRSRCVVSDACNTPSGHTPTHTPGRHGTYHHHTTTFHTVSSKLPSLYSMPVSAAQGCYIEA